MWKQNKQTKNLPIYLAWKIHFTCSTAFSLHTGLDSIPKTAHPSCTNTVIWLADESELNFCTNEVSKPTESGVKSIKIYICKDKFKIQWKLYFVYLPKHNLFYLYLFYLRNVKAVVGGFITRIKSGKHKNTGFIKKHTSGQHRPPVSFTDIIKKNVSDWPGLRNGFTGANTEIHVFLK